MRVFSENKWEASNKGDSLSEQLFQKHSKNQKKKRNSKLNSFTLETIKGNSKKLMIKNVELSHEDQLVLKNERNPKKRQKKITNVDKNAVSKNFKFSSEHNEKSSNKNALFENLTKACDDNNKNDSQTADNNKKSIVFKHNNTRTHKNSKLKQKEENKLKNLNKHVHKAQKININKIQLLLTKKNGSKNGIDKPNTLRDRMMTQLRASRFRYLNETLYNNRSFESRKMFMEDPDAFTAYHTGYRQQVKQWPLNPLDIVIAAVQKMPKDYLVADFGCGEARLSNSVEQNVTSLDLVAMNDNVIACDMAHTPLLTNSIHVVVFCLSLMGNNLSDYLLEANRVLKKDGILKIAEIESRFENVEEFMMSLREYGFKSTWKDISHNLFYFMDFQKVSDVDRQNKKIPTIVLKSCLYKRR
ncbi:hypothetical protein PV326_004567 [Microctonus aethiopoides]|uniref:Ribosomal RNA-processing protein 8 n=1 Tax=Microctonus aethiopoides TaxID=144406 RepID=A0AA39C7N0_9HYME|nr:hypothetical protein PV326_004567 [Microctonus aethiopoides]KAK0159431.1 hypothetical protein PV328_010309 [Microctonus aethiopoides]